MGINDIEEKIDIFDDIVSGITGNPFAITKVGAKIACIPDLIFWNKFQKLYQGVNQTPYEFRKISERLAEHEHDSEYAFRLIKIIDDIDTMHKTQYLINLTRALLSNMIEREEYFRYCNILTNLIDEDIKFLINNIDSVEFEESITTLTLESKGLMYESMNGYAFSRLAYLFDKFCTSYGNEYRYKYNGEKDSIPDKLPMPKNYVLADEKGAFGGGPL